MRRAYRCQRCNGGAVPAQGMMCLGCRQYLGAEASERWISEWRREHPASEYLLAKQAARRPGPIWTPDREPSHWDWIISEGMLMLVLFIFIVVGDVLVGDWQDFTYWMLGALGSACLILTIYAFSKPADDADAQAPESENSGEP
jgi:hypothetical protein